MYRIIDIVIMININENVHVRCCPPFWCLSFITSFIIRQTEDMRVTWCLYYTYIYSMIKF